jgi:hypothetical protein
MSAKSKKDKVPSWIEVGLGALLSVLLGAVIGAALLVFKPVLKVKDIPKDPPAGAVYYIEGSKDFSKSSEAEARRKEFAAGQTVTVDEGEINMLLGSYNKPVAAAGAKPDPKAPAPPARAIDVGDLNARIKDGKLQLASTVAVNVFGFSTSLIVQARGGFERSGSTFEFSPDTVMVGGCPVQRIPFLRGWVLKNMLLVSPAPPDVAAAWPKLANVTIEGPMLKLSMP